MSINMPTLFDDEEYFVPPPKKDSRKKKDMPETEEEAEIAVTAGPVGPPQPLTEAVPQPGNIDAGEAIPEITAEQQPVADARADIRPEPGTGIISADVVPEEVLAPVVPVPPGEDVPETNVTAGTPGVALTESVPKPEIEKVLADAPKEIIAEQEAIEPVAPVQPELEEAPEMNVTAATPVEKDEVVVTEPTPEPEVTEEQVLADEPGAVIPEAIELEPVPEEVENKAAALMPEIIEVSAVDELAVELPKAAAGITFEIPDEDEEPAIELEMTARPIPAVREDKVDDLDQLMRTELISQDYSAFSGFAFEPLPEKKKITPEPETEVAAKESATAPEKEDISLAVQDIDAAGLDFEFESHALAASLPEFALENKYYTIGEVAALFVVNVSHIRFWTTEFNLKVRTTRKGDRLYNPENIARLRLIHHLVKENGFTIKGAKDKLKHQKQNVSAQIDLKNKLSGLKDKLERIKKNL